MDNEMKILVVEDGGVVAEEIKTALEADDAINVEVAHNRSDAEQVLSEGEDWDGIVLDLDLGESQGYESYERMRRAAPNSAIIAYSGNLDAVTSQRLAEDGVRVLIRGLSSPSSILPIIKGSIDSFKATRALRALLNPA